MVKRLFVKACLWFADRHTACAALWNDLAECILTGETLSNVRKRNKNGGNDEHQ